MTLNPDIKTKKPPKRVRERHVVKKFKDALAELANKLEVPCMSDHPSSSEFGTAGRPDLYCALGGMEFKVEVKRDEQARLAGTQITWHEHFNSNHTDMFTLPVFVLYGLVGITPLIVELEAHYRVRKARIRFIEREYKDE